MNETTREVIVALIASIAAVGVAWIQIDKKLDHIESAITEIKGTLERHERKLGELNSSFDTLRGKTEQLEERISTNTRRIEIGMIDLPVTTSPCGSNQCISSHQHVDFGVEKRFKRPPKVITSIASMGGVLGGNPNAVRISVWADRISETGFEVVVRSWDGSGIGGATVAWVAQGE